MKVERLSYKKIQIVHKVPINYRCGDFISDKVCERRVREVWKDKDGILYKCGFKHKFFASLSNTHSFKIKNIHLSQSIKYFEFEGEILKLAVTDNFYFEIDEVKMRDYKLKKLLDVY